jgi:hypothetical protein
MFAAAEDNADGSRPEFGSGLRRFLARRGGIVDEPPEFQEARGVVEVPAEGGGRRPYHFDLPDLPQLEHDARAFLAYRAEEEAELLWSVFADALGATTESGRPDHRTRLLAARTLLAEVKTDGPVRAGRRARVRDELADLRRRRAGG